MPTNIYDIMAQMNGSTFVGLDTITNVPLKGGKSNPFQNRVTKKTEGSQVMSFQNKHSNGYEQMVFRRLIKEGKNVANFTLGPRKWGTRIDGTPFIQHFKDGQLKYYLEVIFLKPGTTTYFVDGQLTDPSTITGLDEKQEADQGGLEDKVIIRTISIENITALRAFGQQHTELFLQLPN